MRRLATFTLSATLALSLAACGTAQAPEETTNEPAETTEAVETTEEATTEEHDYAYTYEGIEQWDVADESMGGMSMRDMMTMMAKPGTDMDAYIGSEIGEFTLNSGKIMYMGDLGGDAVTGYWAGLGMTHEVHDADDEDHLWTSLVPADIDESDPRPLLFVWHGNDNPVGLAEGYGFGEEAAERGWIVVYPWAANDDEYLEEFDRILAYMEESYPVDASRIYTTGFSKGGRVSARLALERADVIAAAAPNGTTAAASFYNPDGSKLELTGPQQLSDDDFAKASALVPIQFWAGALDVYGAMPYDADYKIDGINGWLGLQGNDRTQSLEASEALLSGEGDEVEHAIGLSFDETESVEADGTTYHVGSYLDADGKATIRVIECDGAIHWPTPSMAKMGADFLESYSK